MAPLAPSMSSLTQDAISSSFVVDCMSRKTLLPLSTYRLAGAAAPAQAAGSAASAPSRAPAAKASPAHPARGQKREKFTREEFAIFQLLSSLLPYIINYIIYIYIIFIYIYTVYLMFEYASDPSNSHEFP